MHQKDAQINERKEEWKKRETPPNGFITPKKLAMACSFKFYGYIANMKACGPTLNVLESSKTEFNKSGQFEKLEIVHKKNQGQDTF